MSFEVHPGVGAEPLRLEAGGESAPVAFTEFSETDPASSRNLMYLNVVQVDDGDAPAAPPPSIALIADSGPPTPIGSTPTPIVSEPGASEPAATATLTSTGAGVSVVEVEVLAAQLQWRLQIANADQIPHRYVWVVGSTDREARRPWLDVLTGPFTVTVRPGSTATHDVTVANYGSGDLTLDESDGSPLGPGLTLSSLTPRPVPPNSRAVIRMALTPSSPGAPAATRALASNDPAAGAFYGHSNRLVVTVDAGPPPLWGPDDVLILLEVDLCRRDKASGGLIPLIPTNRDTYVRVAVDPKTGDAILLDTGVLKRVDRFTGESTTLTHPQLTEPTGLAVHPDGSIILADRQGDVKLLRIPATGGPPLSVTPVPGLGTLADMAVEAGGDVILLQRGQSANGKVLRVSAATGRTTTVAEGGQLTFDTGYTASLTLAADGAIIVGRGWEYSAAGAHYSGTLIRLDPQNPEPRTFHTLSAPPDDIAATADGTVLAVVRRRIVAVNPGGGGSTDWAYPGVRRVVVVPRISG